MHLPANLGSIGPAVIEERTIVRSIAYSYTDDYFNTYVLIRKQVDGIWSGYSVLHMGLEGREEPLYMLLSGPQQTYETVALALEAISAHWTSWGKREVSQDRYFADDDLGATVRSSYERHHQLRRTIRRGALLPDPRSEG